MLICRLNIWCEVLTERYKMPFLSGDGNQLCGTEVQWRLNFQLEQILVTEINEIEWKGMEDILQTE